MITSFDCFTFNSFLNNRAPYQHQLHHLTINSIYIPSIWVGLTMIEGKGGGNWLIKDKKYSNQNLDI